MEGSIALGRKEAADMHRESLHINSSKMKIDLGESEKYGRYTEKLRSLLDDRLGLYSRHEAMDLFSKANDAESFVTALRKVDELLSDQSKSRFGLQLRRLWYAITGNERKLSELDKEQNKARSKISDVAKKHHQELVTAQRKKEFADSWASLLKKKDSEVQYTPKERVEFHKLQVALQAHQDWNGLPEVLKKHHPEPPFPQVSEELSAAKKRVEESFEKFEALGALYKKSIVGASPLSDDRKARLVHDEAKDILRQIRKYRKEVESSRIVDIPTSTQRSPLVKARTLQEHVESAIKPKSRNKVGDAIVDSTQLAAEAERINDTPATTVDASTVPNQNPSAQLGVVQQEVTPPPTDRPVDSTKMTERSKPVSRSAAGTGTNRRAARPRQGRESTKEDPARNEEAVGLGA